MLSNVDRERDYNTDPIKLSEAMGILLESADVLYKIIGQGRHMMATLVQKDPEKHFHYQKSIEDGLVSQLTLEVAIEKVEQFKTEFDKIKETKDA